MSVIAPQTRDGATDVIHKKLCRAVEKRQRAHLWTPADAINFVPRLLPTIYGDGRALFTIATINQRPAYWIIRACSTWGCGSDREDSSGPDFAEMTDDILTALEDAFGNGRCGYSGNSLFWPKKERKNALIATSLNGLRWMAAGDAPGAAWIGRAVSRQSRIRRHGEEICLPPPPH